MTPKQIQSLLTVVETGSVNRAAELLHLAPSSVSAQLRALSSELGIRLFDQAGRRIVLSSTGQALLPRLREFDALVQDIRQQAQSAAQEPKGEIKLFAPSSMCIYRLPVLIEALQVSAPQLEVTLTHEPFDYQRALNNREIDAAILLSAAPDPQWAHHMLAPEKVIYVCHPKRYQARVLTLEELSQQDLLTTEPGCTYRLGAEMHFQAQGYQLKPRQTFSNVEVVKRCLLMNMGMGLLPECVVADELRRGNLVQQAVADTPYDFQSRLVYPANSRPMPKLQALIDTVQQFGHLGQIEYRGANYEA